ncbi:MAG TPA: 30S ribosomal protein S14, partial [Sulfurihydrogenibium azorense]|nr:30S ribosomal protein S14 [Sulfurihydrogenibium azorense]
MARKCLIVKAFQKKPKYKTRVHSRCPLCGRPRGYIRQF